MTCAFVAFIGVLFASVRIYVSCVCSHLHLRNIFSSYIFVLPSIIPLDKFATANGSNHVLEIDEVTCAGANQLQFNLMRSIRERERGKHGTLWPVELSRIGGSFANYETNETIG